MKGLICISLLLSIIPSYSTREDDTGAVEVVHIDGETPINFIDYGGSSLLNSLNYVLNSIDPSEYSDEDIKASKTLPAAALNYLREFPDVVETKKRRSLTSTSDSIRFQNMRMTIEDQTGFTTWDSDMKASLQSAINWLEKSLTLPPASSIQVTTGSIGSYCSSYISSSHVLVTTGVATDYYLIVTATTDSCSSSTLGWATPCVRDQVQRPILGRVNICSDAWSSTSRRFRYKTAFFVHELTHGLGFTSDSMSYFRSSTDMLSTGSSPQTTINGKKYLNTSVLNTMAAGHFGCSSPIGVALEDEGDSSTAGSHFEKRIFGNEALTGVVSGEPIISIFTLGYLEDSGWYIPLYEDATELIWGRKDFLSGDACNFINLSSKCLTLESSGTTDSNFNTWCTSDGGYDVCAFDATAAGRCILRTYTSALSSDYQYFSSSVVGGDMYWNYCPLIQAYTVSGKDYDTYCFRDTQGSQTYGDTYGSSSKCVSSTVIHPDYNSLSYTAGRCYIMTCLIDQAASITADYPVFMGVEINVKSDFGMASIPCFTWEEGQTRTISGMTGAITCPNVKKSCFGQPCLNGGFFKNNKCACRGGFTGATCAYDDTFDNRQYVPEPFRYSSSYGSTLKSGDYYELSISSGVSVSAKSVLQITTSYDTTSYYAAVSTLPTGLYVESTTGTIKGTPTVASSCKIYTITRVGSRGDQYRATIALAVAASLPTQPTFGSYNLAKNCGNPLSSTSTQPSGFDGSSLTNGVVAPDIFASAPYAKVLSPSEISKYTSNSAYSTVGVSPVYASSTSSSLVMAQGSGTVYYNLNNGANIAFGTALALAAIVTLWK